MASDPNVRVDVGLLDHLMNLVGELVLARNQILQCSAGHTDSNFVAASQRLNLLATELQEGVMRTRMQPIGSIWSKLPRVVRDLSLGCGRRVAIVFEGRDTELDKTIIEAIKDPLTHLVRNAVDHGIEPPDVRAAAGKPAEGRLTLRAHHDGGQVRVAISDDGAGIPPETLRRRALERGLITAEQAARMNDRDALKLIFLSGVSTGETVPNVSRRGVGMHAVRTSIERIGGSIDVQSTVGVGTTITITIPPTLAIIPALIVTSGSDRYAIPQANLLELVRLEADAAREQIEHINGTPVYRLRGDLLPLVYLDRELNIQRPATAAAADQATNIVALQAGEVQFGLVVDEVNHTEEIFVKPLGKQIKGLTAFAGATIRSDGRVALILDVLGLAQQAQVRRQVVAAALAEPVDNATADQSDREALLLVATGESDRVAMPLRDIGRLEEIPASRVRHVGGREVVQYGGVIMPLVRLSEVLGYTGASGGETLQVVVYSPGRQHIGLVVDRILDIVEEVVVVQGGTVRPGLVGSAVIQNRATDLLDIGALIRGYDPSLLDTSGAAAEAG